MTARGFLLTGLLLLTTAACGDDAAAPSPGALSLLPESAELDTTRTIQLTLRNTGERTVGPVSFEADAPLDAQGTPLPGAALVVEPATVTSLAPGASVSVSVTVAMPAAAPAGSYTVALRASAGDVAAAAALRLRVVPPATPQVRITAPPASVRQGDVVLLTAEATDGAGAVIEDPAVTWSVLPANAGLVTGDGRFVGYEPGTVRVIAALGHDADTVSLQVSPRGLSGALSVVGRGPVPTRFTSDLWVHGAHAYTGTWGSRTVAGTTRPGNTLYAWSIANPASPVITDSVVVDASTVNDVKVSADGRLGVLTHEGGDSQAPNGGITLLDLADPAHPRVHTRFTQGLESGVHNVWVEGGHVYVVVNGFGLRIVDVADPLQPRVVAAHATQHLHDVYVRDGLAFLSDFQAGLIVLDVGDGRAGGSPAAPVEVASVEALGGQTHNAWYWPSAGWVFVGEEDYSTPGVMHVVDARELAAAHEVATFGVPGDAPHNFWLDEQRAILYMAWYSNGLRALDVSGELLGDLSRQGRELASLRYATGGACPGGAEATCTWAPQLHDGLVWVSDMNNGLLSIQPSF